MKRPRLAIALGATFAASIAIGDPSPGDATALWERSLAAQRLIGMHAEVTLETHTPAGDVITLKLHALGKLADDGVNRMLMARVTAGMGSFVDTSFLSVEHRKDPDDLWLYLPALGHPKRITSSNLGDSFMGSELTFGDLIQPEPPAYDVSVRPVPEPVDGEPCWVVEAKPRDPALERGTGVGREMRWLDTTRLLERRIEQYDRRGALLRVTHPRRWTSFGEPARWLAVEREVRNVQTNGFSIATFSDVRSDGTLDPSLFSAHSLSERSW